MSTESLKSGMAAGESAEQGVLARLALGFTGWAEKWFPDSFIFAAVALVIVVHGEKRVTVTYEVPLAPTPGLAADRLPGSLAALAAARAGRASIVRVHDVAESVRFVRMLDAIDAQAVRQPAEAVAR